MPFVQLDDLKAYYERAGSGPRLLFISGSGGDLRVKPGVFESPLARGFDLLGYDQRGLGQTDKPAGPYSMQDYADDAAKLLDALDWQDALVVGVSFGGMVAQEFALRHPRRISKLVLACTSSGGEGGASYPLHEDRGHADRGARAAAAVDQRHATGRRVATGAPAGRRTGIGDGACRGGARCGRPVASHRRGTATRCATPARHVESSARTATCRCFCARANTTASRRSETCGRWRTHSSSELRVYEGGHLFLIQDRAAYPDIVEWLRN